MSKLKLVKTADEPYCEHCGQLEIGSFMLDDGLTGWCLVCANANDTLTTARLNKLLVEERSSRIVAHRQRIEALEED